MPQLNYVSVFDSIIKRKLGAQMKAFQATVQPWE